MQAVIDKAIFDECEWRNELLGEDTLDDLIRKSELFQVFKTVRYILFSKSGFTTALENRAAEQDDITLVVAGDMFF